MNVGIYSFSRLECNQVNILSIKIKDKLLVNNIYLYLENTTKQRISKREALYRIIKDYEQGIIDAIVFEDFKSLGSDLYIRGKILKLLLENNISFFFIKEDFESTSIIGKEQIKIMIFTATKFKEENDRRSVMGNIIKDGENGIVHAKYKNTIVISKDEERLKRFIRNF